MNKLWFNQAGDVSRGANMAPPMNGSSGQTLVDIPLHQACKYITSHGICDIYNAHMANGDVQSAMQAVSTFAYQEGISSRDAYPLILQCCGDNTPGEIPCEGFWPSVQQQQGWCQKWAQAQASGNQLQIQAEISNLATAFNITNDQAESVFVRCCPGTSSGEPCPPTDPNSPFYTTDNFCISDFCIDGQGNPLPNAHPDCVCCPGTNTSTGPCPPADPNSPYNTNAPEFCPNCVPGGYYYGHPDCVCCPGNNEIDVSPWCDQYVIAVDNADLSAMQQIITQVSTTFNITWQQASQLLYDECICPNSTDVCKDPNWAQLPAGGQIGEPNYPGGKNNYCDRCGANSQGAVFPVSWNSVGGWQYDPQNGINYCQCCPPSTLGNPDVPCGSLNEEAALCQGHIQSLQGQVQLSVNFYSNIASQLGVSEQEAIAYMNRCCGVTTQTTGGNTGTTTSPDMPMARQAQIGSPDNPLGLGSLSDQKLYFTGPNNTRKAGDFLTDDPGDTQTFAEFEEDVP